MEMMMGPVTTGGKNFMMRRMPNTEISPLTSTYSRPLNTQRLRRRRGKFSGLAPSLLTMAKPPR